MSAKRQKRLKQRDLHHRRQETRKRHEYEAILDFLGLLGGFRKLPRAIQDFVCQQPLPKPEVIVDPSVASGNEASLMQKAVQQKLAETKIDLIDGRTMGLFEFLQYARPLPRALAVIPTSYLPLEQVPYLLQARRVSDDFWEANQAATNQAFIRTMYTECLWFSRMDSRLLTFQASEEERPHRLPHMRVRLSAVRPEEVTVTVDGKPRPVFRVGGAVDRPWVTLHSEHLSLAGEKKAYPVYIQSHALLRLHERLQTGEGKGLYEEHVYQSLARPHVVDHRGDDYLVEYRLGADRLGYLVVRLLEDKAVVRTFLFLTMQGTPESRALRERLRLHRPDVEYQGLDEFSTFWRSDLAQDPELHRLLSECGCGPLLSYAGVLKGKPSLTGVAGDLRRHLGMKPLATA